MSANSTHAFSKYEWLCPTLLAALAATRFAPLAAPAVMLLLAYLPGRYLLTGFGLGTRWDRAGRAVLSVAASLAIVPVLLNPLWHWTNDGYQLLSAIWILTMAGFWIARRFAVTTAGPSDRLIEQKSSKIIMALVALLVTLVTIGTYWPTEALGYPVPALIHDFIKHHAVLFSLEQRPLPLGNPFYAAGASGPVYYYHFFYLIPATLRAICPTVSIELAFGLQSALIALATAAMFYIIVKRFTGSERCGVLAVLLSTVVGGLDIIPLIIQRRVVITLDAWADTLTRIHNFFTQMVWTPQNVQGVLILLLGVYVLSQRGWWRGWLLLGPLLAASLLGSSVWIAMAVLPALFIWVLFELVTRRGDLKRIAAAALVALLMLVAATPSLLGYLQMSERHAKSLTLQWPHPSHALLGKLAPPGILANLLDLPWYLAIEFGPLLLFPLVLPRSIWQRAWRDDGLRLLLIAAAVALVGFVSVRSHFTYNDFGQKIIMVAMSAGVVLGACVLAPRETNVAGASRSRAITIYIALLLLAGLPVGLYQSPLVAVRRFLPQDGPLKPLTHDLSRSAAQEASLIQFLRHGLPPDAVIQGHWNGDARKRLCQLARKQIGVIVLDRDTEVFVPADRTGFDRCLDEVSIALTEPGEASACRRVLERYGITHVVIGTIEREQWGGLSKFDSPDDFEPVFSDGPLAVYAVRTRGK